jgi:5'-3' exonuclease
MFLAMADRMYLDAPSLVYRAFFALPKTITDPDGRPVNAVRGFMEMTTRLLRDHQPEEIVAAFDSNFRPDFRVRAYPGYKADRPEDPPELPGQFDVLAKVLDAAGIRHVEAPDLEADDALATLVEAVPAGKRALIVTGDRDLLALVRDPEVHLLFTVRGVSELEEFGEKEVTEKYGVPPSLYPEFAILRGDPSDGLPGVSGIGPKRAVSLLEEFGSVEAILENIDRLPPRQRVSFEDASGYLEAMKTVVILKRDAKLSMSEAHPPDEEALRALSERHGLGGSGARLMRALKSRG